MSQMLDREAQPGKYTRKSWHGRARRHENGKEVQELKYSKKKMPNETKRHKESTEVEGKDETFIQENLHLANFNKKRFYD